MPRPKSESPTVSLAVRKGGHYYVQWWEDGAAKRISCRTTIAAEARRFLAEFRAGRAVPSCPEAPTIRTIMDGYSKDRLPHVYSPGTITNSAAPIIRLLGDLPSDLLSKVQVAGYVVARREEACGGAPSKYRKRVISDGTLRRELGCLRTGLAWAVREGWIASAPHIELPPAPQPRERWLSYDEAAALMRAVKMAHIRVFIGLAIYTAARHEAILELTWDRVDLTRRVIDFGPPRGRKRRSRHTPISDPLLAILLEAKLGSTCNFVVQHGDAAIASISRGFMFTAKRAGLANVTPHVLRHTAVTWMVQAGVPISEVAGYAAMSQGMVERVYGHHSPDHMKKAVAALSRSLT
jgi:integrase